MRVTCISTACNTQHAFNFRLVCTVAGESTLSSSDSAIKTTDVKKEMNNYLCLEVQPSDNPLQWWHDHKRHFLSFLVWLRNTFATQRHQFLQKGPSASLGILWLRKDHVYYLRMWVYLFFLLLIVGGLLDIFKVCTHLVCPVTYLINENIL